MKFFFGIFLVALVALATAEHTTSAPEPVNEPITTEAQTAPTNIRNKRGFILSTYAAPVAAVPVAAPAYTYTYSAASLTPYAYSAYSTYSPYYYPYPALYV